MMVVDHFYENTAVAVPAATATAAYGDEDNDHNDDADDNDEDNDDENEHDDDGNVDDDNVDDENMNMIIMTAIKSLYLTIEQLGEGAKTERVVVSPERKRRKQIGGDRAGVMWAGAENQRHTFSEQMLV
ncbi:hypothetical protein PoB_005286900 [Plakobranchus ocellatus]|uniref:Uncharacterized protein n=1 Tax=Plakobranchus ocellatus TaxID=259542 RepID=A0AAV4C5M8_9GAST|nr:hypothetical protein PoB_005286900 [Plakobranchus ocellatus]